MPNVVYLRHTISEVMVLTWSTYLGLDEMPSRTLLPLTMGPRACVLLLYERWDIHHRSATIPCFALACRKTRQLCSLFAHTWFVLVGVAVHIQSGTVVPGVHIASGSTCTAKGGIADMGCASDVLQGGGLGSRGMEDKRHAGRSAKERSLVDTGLRQNQVHKVYGPSCFLANEQTLVGFAQVGIQAQVLMRPRLSAVRIARPGGWLTRRRSDTLEELQPLSPWHTQTCRVADLDSMLANKRTGDAPVEFVHGVLSSAGRRKECYCLVLCEVGHFG
jgi:hypothetical protein